MPAAAARSLALPNGLVLVGEPSDRFRSAAMALLLPAGCRADPADRLGIANLTCEMALRGAGDRDSHQLVDDLDALGVERGESVGVMDGTTAEEYVRAQPVKLIEFESFEESLYCGIA